MGLTKWGADGVYLSIADGKLTRTHKEPINGRTVSRVNKKGNTVHEEKFDAIEGLLTGLTVRENDFGKQYVLSVLDGEDKYFINIMYSSRYATSLLKALPNVDIAKPVKLMPWSMQDQRDKTKTATGVTMWQGKDKIAPAFTKEEPNGMPEMKKVKVKGKDVWDTFDMDTFLEAKAMAVFARATKKETSAEPENMPF